MFNPGVGYTYEQHEYWVKSYLNDILWVTNSTIGRSESMNAYFDG